MRIRKSDQRARRPAQRVGDQVSVDYLLLTLAVWSGWLLLVAAPIIGGCYWLCRHYGWDGSIPGPNSEGESGEG